MLNPDGDNNIAIAVWNLDGSTGGLGTVSLTNYGSYASSLHGRAERQPPLQRGKVRDAEAHRASSVDLQVPGSVSAGQQFTATATVSVPADGAGGQGRHRGAERCRPAGRRATSTPAGVDKIVGGEVGDVHLEVTAPTAGGRR